MFLADFMYIKVCLHVPTVSHTDVIAATLKRKGEEESRCEL